MERKGRDEERTLMVGRGPEGERCPQCGADLAGAGEAGVSWSFCAQCRFPLLEIAGKYRLERLLGQGGMGSVYLARHAFLLRDNERVIKVIAAREATERMVLRFQREVQVTASLSQSNEHVVRIYDDFGHEPRLGYYYVMEHLRGPSLRDLLDEHDFLPVKEALHLFGQLCDAMAAAHQLGIVHRDLKPENLLLVQRGQERRFLKVIDFGIAHTLAADEAGPLTQGMLGTPLYMPPEQCLNQPIDARADIYAMGVILYEMLTGLTPFDILDDSTDSESLSLVMAQVHRAPQPICSRFPELQLPPMLDGIVLRMLAKDPANRFQSVEELWQMLASLPFLQEGVVGGTAIAGGQTVDPQRPVDPQQTADPQRPVDFQQADDRQQTIDPSEQEGGVLEGSAGSWGSATITSESGYEPGSVAPAIHALARTLSSEEMAAVPSRPTWGRTNLRPYTTSFVGRRADLDELSGLLAGGERLVTLLGPGGTGKSRLATHFGLRYLEEVQPPGGVWFVDLTEVRSLWGTLEAMAATLQVPLSGGKEEKSVEQLGYALVGRGAVLLIFDNVEQIVSVAAEVLDRWQKQAGEARFLVTSRERLRLAGEVTLPLQPLPEEDAVQLFVERARTVRSSFAPTDENRPVLEEITRRLDRLPLAIELAAARVNVLTPQALLQRLSQRFRLLGGGARGVAPRQATLRGAIDWSWDLLEPWEREAFAQCGVFRGGFSLEAAERVMDLSEYPEAPWTLDLVEALKDKSLLRSWEPPGLGGELRFGMYESIGEYATEKLKESPHCQEVEARHAACYLELGEELAEGVYRHGGVSRLHRLASEAENLLAIYQRYAQSEPTTALRALVALSPVLSTRGSVSEYLSMLDAVLSKTSALDEGLQARALRVRGEINRRIGQMKEAHRDLEAALEMARQQEDGEGEGETLNRLGNLLRVQGKMAQAEELHLQALELYRRLGQRRGEGIALGHLGNLERLQSRLDKAEANHLQALAIHREVGDRRGEGIALGQIGNLYRMQGRLEDAERYYSLAFSIHQELGDRRGVAIDLNNLGNLHLRMGRLVEAASHYQQALVLQREVGDRRGEGIALGQMGNLYRMQGRLAEAETCQRQALALQQELGDRRGEGIGLNNLGNLYRAARRLEEAESCYQRALTIHEQLNDRTGQGIAWLQLGNVALERGTTAEAARPIQQALSFFAEAQARAFQGSALCALGLWHRLEGRPDAARACFERAIDFLKEDDNQRTGALLLAFLGALQADEDQSDEAQQSLLSAKQILQAYHDWLGLALVEVCQGHLDLAQARASSARGDHDEAQALLLQAASRQRAAESQGTFSDTPPDALPASSCSGDVRLALRLLQQRLDQ